ncbi:hypothetical protein EI94DRAFT_1821834 [Lactarius quietus]|nr:hypothetical protein EI94DRAFT_1821834 [Lactarius quietus]
MQEKHLSYAALIVRHASRLTTCAVATAALQMATLPVPDGMEGEEKMCEALRILFSNEVEIREVAATETQMGLAKNGSGIGGASRP